ncbi:hypothetical protein APHAL10511_006531 [Amanita phalloides]|nr:hypothetical protein APHAL10511_006531 [Amanita phalloides]
MDPYQSELRGRRRSSVYHLNTLPHLFIGATIDDVAVHDEYHVTDLLDAKSSAIDSVQISPLTIPSIPSNAHLPDLATKFTIPRHFDTKSSPIDVSTPSTPSLSRKPSFTELLHGNDRPSTPELKRLKWRLAAGYFTYFLCGWGDGVTATVLPYFMADFHLNSMTSSLLFLGSTCGFATGSFVVERLLNFLGRFNYMHLRGWLLPTPPHLRRCMGKQVPNEDIVNSVSHARFLALMMGCVLHTSFFLIMASRRGFPAMFIAYAAAAFARALWTAPLNAYFVQGPMQSIGFSYGLWSFGGVSAPLTAQAIIAKGIPWPNFYYGSMIISGLNFVFLFLTYRPTTKELLEEQRAALTVKRKDSDDNLSEVNCSMVEGGSSPASTVVPMRPRKEHSMTKILEFDINQMTFSCSASTYAFIAYVLGFGDNGDIIYRKVRNPDYQKIGLGNNPAIAKHYLDNNADGNLLATGQRREFQHCWICYIWILGGDHDWKVFVWLCIATSHLYTKEISDTSESRSVLVPLRHSTRPSNFISVIAFVMHILIWLTANVFGNALCASIIGLLYGPVYPELLGMATDVLPDEVHLVSMAIISTTASTGSALLSFVLGTILKLEGVRAMSYMMVPLAAILATWWAFLPSRVPSSRIRRGI